MNGTCPDTQELDGESDENIAAHVAECAVCLSHIDQTRRLDALIKATGRHRLASPDLLAKLEDKSKTMAARQSSSRRSLAAGAIALAASIVGILVLSNTLQPRTARAHSLAPVLFSDFQTYLAANASLDLAGGDAATLYRWLSPNLPFNLPDIGGGTSLELIGARLCWLLERRVGSLSYLHADQHVVIYVNRDKDLQIDTQTPLPESDDPPFLRAGPGIAATIRRRGELVVTLVGSGDTTTIRRLATSLHIS